MNRLIIVTAEAVALIAPAGQPRAEATRLD